MSHYDTLGVPSDASPDEIKRAFRAKASEHHPDRGGDGDKMAAVNTAWLVLGDPDSRRRYDETGSDTAAPTIEAEARGMLLTMFSTVLEGEGNLLADVSRMLGTHRAALLGHQSKAFATQARLTKRTGKVRAKGGENLVQMLIDQKLQQLEAALDNMARGLAVNAAATEALRQYEQDEEQVTATAESVYLAGLQGVQYGGMFGGFGR